MLCFDYFYFLNQTVKHIYKLKWIWNFDNYLKIFWHLYDFWTKLSEILNLVITGVRRSTTSFWNAEFDRHVNTAQFDQHVTEQTCTLLTAHLIVASRYLSKKRMWQITIPVFWVFSFSIFCDFKFPWIRYNKKVLVSVSNFYHKFYSGLGLMIAF